MPERILQITPGELIKVKYERAKGRIHTLIGRISVLNKTHMKIELQDGELITVYFDKIQDEIQQLKLFNKAIREKIILLSDTTIFLEYTRQKKVHRTIGDIKQCYEHVFNFCSIHNDIIIDIHYDEVIQIGLPDDHKPIKSS